MALVSLEAEQQLELLESLELPEPTPLEPPTFQGLEPIEPLEPPQAQSASQEPLVFQEAELLAKHPATPPHLQEPSPPELMELEPALQDQGPILTATPTKDSDH